tara:strand:+ start:469 stop:972 length:504 start_codon:yes stop_codon:yes gene_type:complete
LAEHWTFNPLAIGSNPIEGTTYISIKENNMKLWSILLISWTFGYVGMTAVLTSACTDDEKAEVQAPAETPDDASLGKAEGDVPVTPAVDVVATPEVDVLDSPDVVSTADAALEADTAQVEESDAASTEPEGDDVTETEKVDAATEPESADVPVELEVDPSDFPNPNP